MDGLVMRALGVIGGAGLSVMILGSGVASAFDPYTGQPYDKVEAAISGRNGTAVIGSVTGSQLQIDECIVTSWQKPTVLDSRGRNSRLNNYVLHLNCNKAVASPGHPGNSVMTKQGAQRKKEEEQAASIEKNPAWCEETDDRMKWCESICTRTGLCEI
jgi:hypothetical protein